MQRQYSLIFLSLFLLFFSENFAVAQPSPSSKNVVWEKVFGGKMNDKATDVVVTPNGDLLVLGYTKSSGAGNNDYYVLRTDENGQKLWEKTFGSDKSEIAHKVVLTSDNNAFLVGGRSGKSVADSNIYIVKIDKYGQLIWEKTYKYDKYNSAEAAVGTSDGGLLITGRIRSEREVVGNDLYVLRLDKNGDKLWEKAYHLRDNQYGTAISLTADGGALIAGSIKPDNPGSGHNKDYADIYILKIDLQGHKIWEKTYGGKRTEYVRDIALTQQDGAYIVGTTSISGTSDQDAYILRIDKDGQKVWQKTIGGDGIDKIHGVETLPDGGALGAGYSNSAGSLRGDMYLVRVDRTGSVISKKFYGGVTIDSANALAISHDNKVYLAGKLTGISNKGEDMYLLHVDMPSQ